MLDSTNIMFVRVIINLWTLTLRSCVVASQSNWIWASLCHFCFQYASNGQWTDRTHHVFDIFVIFYTYVDSKSLLLTFRSEYQEGKAIATTRKLHVGCVLGSKPATKKVSKQFNAISSEDIIHVWSGSCWETLSSALRRLSLSGRVSLLWSSRASEWHRCKEVWMQDTDVPSPSPGCHLVASLWVLKPELFFLYIFWIMVIYILSA